MPKQMNLGLKTDGKKHVLAIPMEWTEAALKVRQLFGSHDNKSSHADVRSDTRCRCCFPPKHRALLPIPNCGQAGASVSLLRTTEVINTSTASTTSGWASRLQSSLSPHAVIAVVRADRVRSNACVSDKKACRLAVRADPSIPILRPDICVVNHYTAASRLGWHQGQCGVWGLAFFS